MKLKELLTTYNENPQDVDLYHCDYDEESASMVALSMKDFTVAGVTKFRSALDSEVVRITPMGKDWVSVHVKAVPNSAVQELSCSHAGYCSDEDYNRWFTMDSDAG